MACRYDSVISTLAVIPHPRFLLDCPQDCPPKSNTLSPGCKRMPPKLIGQILSSARLIEHAAINTPPHLRQ